MIKTHAALFAGIGTAELAFANAGVETLWSSEFDPTPSTSTGQPTPIGRQWPVRVMKRHFPEVPNFGDVRSITGAQPVDVISFGSPCQDLSVAGKQRGFAEGSRSHLFYEAARIISECKPTFAIWENVPGAFSANAGRDFFAVLNAMGELGATDVAWRVCDSQHFGVPQQRRRIYLVADFGGRRAGEILFDPERCSGHPSPFGEEREDLASTLAAGAKRSGRPGGSHDSDLIARPILSGGGQDVGAHKGSLVVVAHAVSAREGKGPTGAHQGNMTVIQDARNVASKGQNGGGVRQADVAYTLDVMSQEAIAFQPRVARNGRGAPSEIAAALTAQAGENGRGDAAQMIHYGTAIRRFTPTECERLQGLPDGWTCLCGSGGDMFACKCPDGPRYRACGNAMTYNVIAWIARRCVEFS